VPEDRFEPGNNAPGTAPVISADTSHTGLSIHDPADIDFFAVVLPSVGVAQNAVELDFSNPDGSTDLDLILLDANLVAVDASTSVLDHEEISFEGLAAGTYFVVVVSFEESVASYDIRFDVPSATVPEDVLPDRYEPNDTLATASDLLAVEGHRVVGGLTVHTGSDQDFFSFDLLAAATYAHSVLAQTDVGTNSPSIELFDAVGERVRTGNDVAGGQRVSLAGLPAGQYFLRVYSDESVEFEYRLGFATPIRQSGFNITYEFQGGDIPVGFVTALDTALARWSELVADDLPAVRTPNDLRAWEDDLEDILGARFDLPENRQIDDLHIVVRVDPIPSSQPGLVTIARAGALEVRDDLTPYLGILQYNRDRVQTDIASGEVLDTLLHEISHIVTTPWLWDKRGFTTSDGFGFNGENAVREYNVLLGGGSEEFVPLEKGRGPGTARAHWDERIFGNELLTGYDGPGDEDPLSRLTIALLDDLGYTVNYDLADPYVLPGNVPPPSGSTDNAFWNELARLIDLDSSVVPIAAPLDSLFPPDVVDLGQVSNVLSRSQHLPDLTLAPGQQDSFFFSLAELGTAAHSISVTSAIGRPLEFELRDASGTVLSTGLPAGSYLVTQEQPLAYVDGVESPSADAVANDTLRIELSAEATRDDLLFAEQQLQNVFIACSAAQCTSLHGLVVPGGDQIRPQAIAFVPDDSATVTISSNEPVQLQLFDEAFSPIESNVDGSLVADLERGRRYVIYVVNNASASLLVEPQIRLTPVAFPMRNPMLAADVTGDGVVIPLDALRIINHLNRTNDQFPSGAFYDVNGDGLITSNDVLQVINFLNRRPAAEGEVTNLAPRMIFPVSFAELTRAWDDDEPERSRTSRRLELRPDERVVTRWNRSASSADVPSEVRQRLFATSQHGVPIVDDLEDAISALVAGWGETRGG